MQPEQIVGQLLGALVGRKRKRKRKSGLLGMALGGRRGGGLLAGGTLLTAAGLVWGALESMQKSTVASGSSGGGVPPAPPVTPPGTPVVPPPLPGASAPVVPPPLPDTTQAAVAALPLLRVAISAAHADGELSDDEREVIRTQASDLGLAAAVEEVLTERPAVDTLTAAFVTEEQRRAAYAVAWAVIEGDGVISPGERMYLTQLARALRLPPDDVDTIEREALDKEQ